VLLFEQRIERLEEVEVELARVHVVAPDRRGILTSYGREYDSLPASITHGKDTNFAFLLLHLPHL
jgi:hypothetical protein